MSNGRVLLIEDDAGIAESLARVLSEEGYEVAHEAHGDRGLERTAQGSFDVVVADWKLPGLNGLELVRRLHEQWPRLPIILMTAHGSAETAIEAMKLGAYDFLLKPFEIPDLLGLIARAVASHRMGSVPVVLNPKFNQHPDALIGTSAGMQRVFKEIGRVAACPVDVLIRGETGTGKELVARAIYQHGDRAQGPFVAVHCAALPEGLLESLLFGHERGAFTGAVNRRIGRFEQAQGGTIFLDEIGDLSPTIQVKLLRVLQERTIERLGGRETIPLDIRILTATHRPLEMLIRQGQFREDLFFRINVATITLPALCDRREDIAALVQFFVWKYGLSLGGSTVMVRPEALEFLEAQSWPGNVRELENVVRKALLLARGYPIEVLHLREVMEGPSVSGSESAAEQSLASLAGRYLSAAQTSKGPPALANFLSLAEREIFRQAIALAGGNQTQAARWLGISRLTMREKLKSFGLHPGTELADSEGSEAWDNPI